GLPGAGRPDDRHHLAAPHLEVDAPQGLHLGTAPVELPQPGRSNHRAVFHISLPRGSLAFHANLLYVWQPRSPQLEVSMVGVGVLKGGGLYAPTGAGHPIPMPRLASRLALPAP